MISALATYEFLNFFNLNLAWLAEAFEEYADVLVVLDKRPGVSLHCADQTDLAQSQVLSIIPANVVTADSLGNPKLSQNYYNQPVFDAAISLPINAINDCVIETIFPGPPSQVPFQIASAAWNAYVLLYLEFLWLYGDRTWDDPNSFWCDPLARWE